MWLSNDVVAAVERRARITYINKAQTAHWNRYRGEGELRLLTGWTWTSKDGRSYRQGFKTRTVALRDAWYELVRREAVPPVTRLRAVKKAA